MIFLKMINRGASGGMSRRTAYILFKNEKAHRMVNLFILW